MAQVHFKKTTRDSFFGDYLYQMVIPKNHFLSKLKEEIDWESFTPHLLPYYKGGAEYGNSPYPPSTILKLLFLSFLYNLSERQVEEFANFNLPAKYFLGLGVDQKAPDHATLSVFKDRLVKGAGLLPYDAIFKKIVKIALEKKIHFGDIQVIDSSSVPANVNILKDQDRQRKGQGKRDKDASFGVKKTVDARTPQGGKIKVREEVYGFKVHTSFNPESGITTSVKTTPANEFDGKLFTPLVKKDKRLGLKLKTYTADKGYDDGDNRFFLTENNFSDAIKVKDNRLKTKHNTHWRKLISNPVYRQATNIRKQIERSYADAKVKHGLNRARYLGQMKFAIQSYFTFMAMNLKRIIFLTNNIPFKNQTYVYAYS